MNIQGSSPVQFGNRHVFTLYSSASDKSQELKKQVKENIGVGKTVAGQQDVYVGFSEEQVDIAVPGEDTQADDEIRSKLLGIMDTLELTPSEMEYTVYRSDYSYDQPNEKSDTYELLTPSKTDGLPSSVVTYSMTDGNFVDFRLAGL